jgi:hypothetical protein
VAEIARNCEVANGAISAGWQVTTGANQEWPIIPKANIQNIGKGAT